MPAVLSPAASAAAARARADACAGDGAPQQPRRRPARRRATVVNLLALLLHSRLLVTRAAVLSSSELQTCLNDGSEAMECSNKIVLAVTLEHGQGETESAEFLVREVTADAEAVALKKPWLVSWQKSEAVWRYGLRYVQDVNSKPNEKIIQTGWLQCKDNILDNVESLTCGVATSGGEVVEDSQGFCCSCDVDDIFSGTYTRGDLDCSVLSLSESAHCLAWDDLWYSIFEVDTAQISYEITVTLAKPVDPESAWDNVTYEEQVLTLSHQVPEAASEDGAFIVNLVGDLATAVAPNSFESRYLAVPSRPADHAVVNAELPLENAMLIDKSLFGLSGLDCDAIGVSYTAFRNQAERCERTPNSCLATQLEDYYLEDLERESGGTLSTLYLVRGFCEGAITLGQQEADANGATRYLACPLEQRHTTILTLEARADEALFVTNVATGSIVSAVVASFEALQGNGEVVAVVVSTGLVTAEFTLGVDACSSVVEPGPALKLSLAPYENTEQSIALLFSQTGGGLYECTVTLYNAIGMVLEALVVNFTVTDLVVYTPQQDVSRSGADAVDATVGGNDCSDVCPSFFDVLCFLVHECWERLLLLIFVFAAVAATMSCCCWATRRGLLCKLMSCLCKAFSPAPDHSR
eukprot:NODE_2240_length_2260_cov_6.913737.p1 GENE.NODE_2240_length_2260_cov_6.913737~~NODE_2240_length_2260_cov_6.913737.p1  ORF type:complete len:716 (+),score=196.30 NODE_2240_length_2260_cov_6.913737:235-2148(+)